MLARIIIFEGPDGVGKTTLINHIRKEFNDSYYMHLRVHKQPSKGGFNLPKWLICG